MTILHLVVDDKFIDAAIREFEIVAPGGHEYIVLDAVPPFRYLRSARVISMRAAAWAQRVRADDVTAVVLHSLPPHHLARLQEIPAGPAVIWLGWGYDYYGLLNDAYPEGLVMSATRAALAQLQPRQPGPDPGVMRASELSLARPYAKPSRSEQVALQRVDYFAPVLSDEFDLVRREQPWFGAQPLQWNYLTLEDDLVIEGAPGELPGPDLLVGNSATPTNNHVEAFALIRERIDLQGRRVVVPLSYGDAHYADWVSQVGRQTFGPAFLPLRDFIGKDDYIQLLRGCGTVVMNHLRQQALGNLMISGLLGARLFLDRRNPTLHWLRSRGVLVDTLAELHTRPLAAAERQSNIDSIAAFACRNARRAATARLVETALGAVPA